MDISVYCYECNSYLEVIEEYNEGYPFHGLTIKVKPCPECAVQQKCTADGLCPECAQLVKGE